MKETRQAKQVIVVRKDLNMRKGKIASQAAHAAMKVLLDRMAVVRHDGAGAVERTLIVPQGSAFESWLSGSFTKITVSVDTEAALLNLYEDAAIAKLPAALIRDEGRTEFGGVLTNTCIAIGPAWSDEIDALTGGLPLL